MSDSIYFFDTTLRDGEQVPGCQLNTIEKIEVAKALEELGVDIIEAGFPISSPGEFKSVVEISKNIKNPIICALTRAMNKDIDVAVEALRYAERKRIHTGIGTSDFHIRNKIKSTPEEIIRIASAAVKYARNFVDDVEFYAEDAGRTDNEYLARIVEAVIKAGATVINIPDTTGYCLPNEYGEKIKYLIDNVPNIDRAIISVHCHDDLGMATANAMSGIINGARQVEVTMNGIGERAGNTALEEIAMILKCHNDLGFETNINTQNIHSTSVMVSSLMNMPVQPNKAIVGRNAFAHSSGIHQDGILKNRENYEIIDPSDVGIKESLFVLTARSGKAALNHHLELMGYRYGKEEIDDIYHRFLLMADKKKEIKDEDIRILIGKVGQGDKTLKLEHLQVVCGKSAIPVATVGLLINGEVHTSTAMGNGPVDAAFNAVKHLISHTVHLEEFLIQAITRGSNDHGKVHIQIEHRGQSYYGFGTNTDIVTASVEAFLDAISKI